jgi:hypothetical protein
MHNLLLIACLLCVGACAAPDPETENNDMTQTAPAPRTARAYDFRFVTAGGPAMGSSIQQWTTSLVVKSPPGEAVVECFRTYGDIPGKPIGRFRSILPPDLNDAILDTARAIDFPNVPASTDGGLGSNILNFEFDHEGVRKRKTVNARDAQSMAVMGPLAELLSRAIGDAKLKPERAISISVEPASPGKFSLVVTNIGIGPVTLSDPRALGNNPGRRAGVNVSPVVISPPGVGATPPDWVLLPLAGDPSVRPTSRITLKAGESFRAPTIAWTDAPTTGTSVAQAIFEDYTGPAVDPMTPPDPGAYAVRGATFSNILEISNKAP